MAEWIRMPGLFYRHELEQIIGAAGDDEAGDDWYFKAAGNDDRGRPLIAVYSRPHTEGRLP